MNRVLLTLLLLQGLSYSAEETECIVLSEVESDQISDTTGKSLLTHIERTRECTTRVQTLGECIEWETKDVSYDINTTNYSEIETIDYSKSMGTAISIMSISNQIDNIFSGWKGFCVKGMETDFEWAEDPFYWGSMAMSLYGGDLADSTGAAAEAGASGTVSTMAARYVAKFTSCAVMSSVDMASAINEYVSEDGEPTCDPIDEFCGDEGQQTNESNILTMKRFEYEQVILENPDAEKYLIIIDEPSGIATASDIVTIEIKSLGADEIEGFNASEYEAAQDKIKDMQAMIRAAVIAVQMAACITNGKVKSGSSSSGNLVDEDGKLDAGGAAVAGLSMANPALGAAAGIALNIATSFKDIDSCGDSSDAEAKGERHEKTYESLQINGLCRINKSECVEDNPFKGGCWRRAYTYCCYDQAVSRYLMEEIKAQLGKDWAHCADLTFRELSVINFSQCSQEDKSTGIDGAPIGIEEGDALVAAGGFPSYYDMAQGTYFQAKAQCLNYDHLLDYVVNEFDGKVSTKLLMEQINQITSPSEHYNE
ncbi:MAG: hypothetical protein COB67_00355 [SAR324 cluster bacterium]|uniref:Conjugal transfer protein TraN n=1 Tax=SAR324 cluster bacterium TaxID=2024889 RepID=A0A2A4TBF3_9DELT|nr:MAG: hypothetical protein COB67_00355 [SAR324 cluster bacterium]